MKLRTLIAIIAAGTLTIACSEQPDTEADAEAQVTESQILETEEDDSVNEDEPVEEMEIAPGLSARVLHPGEGEVAEAGDEVMVHYTGWLYDESAEDNRGQKFDSSLDRGEHFQFTLGAGQVIQGWDQGVAGMAIDEVRELTIAPELAYGDRGAGNVIPPGATLVFEVKLLGVQD